MPTQVLMPQLGESVVEGTVSKWLKSIGDTVQEYDALLEVNTDKVDSEIPSPAAGVLLEILVPEGTTVQAGTPLALIGAAGEAVLDGAPAAAPAQASIQAASSPSAAEAPPVPAPAASPGNGGARPAEAVSAPAPAPERGRDLGFISPVVARIAGEHGIDLAQVPGTGQGGRITKKDILAFIERGPQVQAAGADGEAEPVPPVSTAVAAPPAAAPAAPPAQPAPALLPGEVIPLTSLRRAIAEHMVMSKHTSPHVTTVMEADLSRVVAHREANKTAFARDGANLTYTAYLVSAIVAALKAMPVVNSSWSEEGILLHREINVGLAASMGEAGLIVPVIKNADSLSLLGLARTINDLAARARSKQLKPDEVKGGTFTLTNHGTSGSLFATPIINQPQCGILGAGAIQKRVVVISGPGGDSLAIRPMVYLSLTFDHRILDGAIADAFLAKVVEYLQGWDK
jgi:2-oxoglutarate dehydrogenase E2 component (dihydrolipoamide succinyltransferase)